MFAMAQAHTCKINGKLMVSTCSLVELKISWSISNKIRMRAQGTQAHTGQIHVACMPDTCALVDFELT